MFSFAQVLGRHRRFKHGVLSKKAKKLKGKLQCPDCNAIYSSATGLGAHRSRAHGIQGMAKSTVAAREKREGIHKPVDLNCPHCEFVSKNKAGLTLHMNKSHRSEIVKTIEDRPAAIIATNGHHREETHAVANGIPEATLALAIGRFQGFCSGMAYEFDLPPRMFAARLAELIYRSQIR
jgi:uncharacterized C2H2 Zn-finger protein